MTIDVISPVERWRTRSSWFSWWVRAAGCGRTPGDVPFIAAALKLFGRLSHVVAEAGRPWRAWLILEKRRKAFHRLRLSCCLSARTKPLSRAVGESPTRARPLFLVR